MDFKTFFQALSTERQDEFAKLAVAKPSYIRTHLIYRRKIPQPKLMDRLVIALHEFNSGIDRQGLLNFFYPPTDKAEIERTVPIESTIQPPNKHNRTQIRRKADKAALEAERRNSGIEK